MPASTTAAWEIGQRNRPPFFFFSGGGVTPAYTPSFCFSLGPLTRLSPSFPFFCFGWVGVYNLHIFISFFVFLWLEMVQLSYMLVLRGWRCVPRSITNGKLTGLVDQYVRPFFFFLFFFVPFRPDIPRTHPPSSTALCAGCLSLSLSLSFMCAKKN